MFIVVINKDKLIYHLLFILDSDLVKNSCCECREYLALNAYSVISLIWRSKSESDLFLYIRNL